MADLTPFLIAAVSTFSVPSTFVFTASIGKNSHEGTCLSAAAWKYIVNAVHGVLHRLKVTHIAYVETDLVSHFRHDYLEMVAHIILLFSSRENMRISPISVERNRFKTALPNEPIPPVIIIFCL